MAYSRLFFTALLTISLISSVSSISPSLLLNSGHNYRTPVSREFVGGVYAMSNNVTENTLIVYARRRNGTLQLLNPGLKTGGQGADLAAGAPADPLLSAYAIIITPNYRFVLCVNAGSSSVSVFKVLRDFSLRLVHVQPVPGFGPVSIAVSRNLVYVASVDADGMFEGFADQMGILSGFVMSASGKLIPIPNSQRQLTFRPNAIQFSPDRRSLVVSNLFSSFTAAITGSVEELLVFRVNKFGLLSSTPVSTATSTELNNTEARNLPAANGFEIVKSGGVQYVVLTEVRNLMGADGVSAPLDQASSISTWRLDSNGSLFPVQLDVPTGPSVTEGQDAACWIEFAADLSNFWIANTCSNSVSAFSFEEGISTLEEEVAATGPFPVDLWRSRDGRFLYQLFSGSVGVFEIESGGTGAGLTQIQNPMNVPEIAMGIVAF